MLLSPGLQAHLRLRREPVLHRRGAAAGLADRNRNHSYVYIYIYI